MSGIKVRYIKGVGLVQSATGNSETGGFVPPPALQFSHTANFTLGGESSGVHSVSGSSTLTGTLPNASSVPGARFTIRSESEHPHLLTGSSDDSLTFYHASGSGVEIQLEALVGASVILESDGLHYIVLGNVGSHTFN